MSSCSIGDRPLGGRARLRRPSSQVWSASPLDRRRDRGRRRDRRQQRLLDFRRTRPSTDRSRRRLAQVSTGWPLLARRDRTSSVSKDVCDSRRQRGDRDRGCAPAPRSLCRSCPRGPSRRATTIDGLLGEERLGGHAAGFSAATPERIVRREAVDDARRASSESRSRSRAGGRRGWNRASAPAGSKLRALAVAGAAPSEPGAGALSWPGAEWPKRGGDQKPVAIASGRNKSPAVTMELREV